MVERQHRWPVRIYYEDTDAGGIVYHARYLCFCERARTEFLRALGLEHRTLRARHGMLVTVRRATLDLRAPAHLDDALEVVTRIGSARGARMRLRQTVRRGEAVLAVVDLELALVGTDLRPRRAPAELAAALDAWVTAIGAP